MDATSFRFSFRFASPLVCIWLFLMPARAQELKPLLLPPPRTDGGKPLMEAIAQRKTIREIKPDKLSDQILADLLWSGFGINRQESGNRTAPSAMNSQEIDLYVALPEGLYLYEPKTNALKPLIADDLRARTGGQEFAKTAPVTLLFVADLSRLAKAEADKREFYAAFDAGCICQNLYLFCASAGLATVVHDLDRAPLTKAMKLAPSQKVIFAQAIGYPK